jgi:hypothetical protein
MQTSDALEKESVRPNKRGMLRKALVALAIVAAVIAADVALTFMLESYGNFGETVWYEYREGSDAGEQYDTIIIGSSVIPINGIVPFGSQKGVSLLLLPSCSDTIRSS